MEYRMWNMQEFDGCFPRIHRITLHADRTTYFPSSNSISGWNLTDEEGAYERPLNKNHELVYTIFSEFNTLFWAYSLEDLNFLRPHSISAWNLAEKGVLPKISTGKFSIIFFLSSAHCLTDIQQLRKCCPAKIVFLS